MWVGFECGALGVAEAVFTRADLCVEAAELDFGWHGCFGRTVGARAGGEVDIEHGASVRRIFERFECDAARVLCGCDQRIGEVALGLAFGALDAFKEVSNNACVNYILITLKIMAFKAYFTNKNTLKN